MLHCETAAFRLILSTVCSCLTPMIRRRDGDARGGSVFVCVCVPDPLDRALQRELATWATVEADHRSACRWLDEWSGPTEVKEHLACRLEARHQAEWEAHVLRLADLHQRRALLVLAETGERTDEVSGGSGAGPAHQSSQSCSLRCG